MEKRKIVFELTKPVRLIPIVGESDVEITTTGDVLVVDCLPTEHRVRSVTIAETQKASLKRSPHGLYRTVSIRVRADQATETEFHRQLSILFEMALINNV